MCCRSVSVFAFMYFLKLSDQGVSPFNSSKLFMFVFLLGLESGLVFLALLPENFEIDIRLEYYGNF